MLSCQNILAKTSIGGWLDQTMRRAAVDTIIFDGAQVKLPLWKRFYLWTYGRRHWKHISIWVLKDKKREEE